MRYTRLGRCLASIILLSTLEAHADVPPRDSCTKAGEACNNAGQNADKPGVCTQSSCTRASPSGSVTYDCYRCIEGGSGTGGSTSGTGGSTSGTGGSTSSTTNTTKSDSGGCSYSARPMSSLGAVLAGLSLGAVLRRRRRRG